MFDYFLKRDVSLIPTVKTAEIKKGSITNKCISKDYFFQISHLAMNVKFISLCTVRHFIHNALYEHMYISTCIYVIRNMYAQIHTQQFKILGN